MKTAPGVAASLPPAGTSQATLRGAQGALLGFGLVGSVASGWYVSTHPDLLHLEATVGVATVVAVLVGAALVWAVLASPDVALSALLAILYLNLSDALIRSYGLPSVLQLVGVPILLSAWVHHGPGALQRVFGRPLTWLLIAYVLIVLASSSWAERPDLVDQRFADSLKSLVLFSILVQLVTTPRRARLAIWTLVIGGAFLGLLGLVHLLGGVDSDVLGGLARSRRGQIHGSVFDRRLAGPLGDPNFFAQILVILVPAGLYLFWDAVDRRVRILSACCLTLVLTAFVLTYSRGGALALAFVLVASLLAQGIAWSRILKGGLALLLAALVLLPSGFTRRLTTVWQLLPGEDHVPLEVDSSFQERLLLVGTAWEMFVRNPSVGVGAGNYTVRFGEYAELRSFAARDYADPDARRFPHSLYLEVAAETGLLGLTVFLGALFVAVLTLEQARAAFHARSDPRMSGIARALQIGLAGYLFCGLFLHGDFQRYLWIQLGLAAALGAMAAQRPGSGRPAAHAALASPVGPGE